MPDKLQKLKGILELMQNDTVTPKQLGDFLQTVLKTIKDQKDGFQEISNATLLEVQKALEYIESEHGEFMAKVDEKSNEVSGISKELKYQMAQVQKLCQEVMDCKPENGKDGMDADEEAIIESVLSKMPTPEKVILDDAGQIRDKLETLKDEDRLDASAIKNLPEFIKEDKRIGFGSMLKEAPKDGLIYGRQNRAWVEVTTGGGTWGSITGTLSDQTDLQAALDAKQNTITGAATTITSLDLTANRAVISNGSGKIAVSSVTSTELGYLSGVTSAIQTQLNNKWSITGNSGTTAGTNFLGTTDDIDVVFKRDSLEQARFLADNLRLTTASGTYTINSGAVTDTILFGVTGASSNSRLTTTQSSFSLLYTGTTPSILAGISADLNGLTIHNGGFVNWAWPLTDAAGVLVSDGSGTLSFSSSPAVSIPISSLLAATATKSINNADYAQTWAWNTLSSNTGLALSSTSTAADSNTQKVFSISLSGANANSTQKTYGSYITNTHTGTSSTNVAGYFSASGGTNNYAGIFAAGNVGIGTTTPTSVLHLVDNTVTTGTAALMTTTSVTTGAILTLTSTKDLNSQTNILKLNTNGSFAASGPGIAFNNTSGGSGMQLVYTGGNGYLENALTFTYSSTAGLTLMREQASGYGFLVGVNLGGAASSTIPSATFHVKSTNATVAGTPITGILFAGTANTQVKSELIDINFNMARSVQYKTNTYANARSFRIQPPTISAVGASTFTNAATVAISGAPIKSTNATLTNTHALLIEAGAVSTANASYGLTVNAQTGATTNYAAAFLGGNTGFGTATPNSRVHVEGAFATAYVEKTANYTLDATDFTVNCTANSFDITFPTAVGIEGRIYVVKNVGTGTITLKTTSSQTIDGNASATLTLAQWDSIMVQSDNANWIII